MHVGGLLRFKLLLFTGTYGHIILLILCGNLIIVIYMNKTAKEQKIRIRWALKQELNRMKTELKSKKGDLKALEKTIKEFEEQIKKIEEA